MDRKRIERELQVAKQDKNTDVTIELQGDNLGKLRGLITGPAGTPYEGGKFVIEIELSSNYPFSPPKMRFVTKVFHPNISSQTGAICLDILKNEWSPALTMYQSLSPPSFPPQPFDPFSFHFLLIPAFAAKLPFSPCKPSSARQSQMIPKMRWWPPSSNPTTRNLWRRPSFGPRPTQCP